MPEAARAKINLFLHAGAKRADGFHELESLVAFADIGDALSFEAAEGLSLAMDGPFAAALPNDADNLVLRAARALAAHAGIEPHAKITLTKNLPVASGIGGGSADAAAALRGLARLWKLELPLHDMAGIALPIGSDVPVCLASRPAWMTGRGEHRHARGAAPCRDGAGQSGCCDFDGASFCASFIRAPAPARRSPAQSIRRVNWSRISKTTTNDLEAPAREIAPVIGDVLAALSGAMCARMSGSGATCFGIYADDIAASNAAAEIARAHPAWWVKVTHTI